MEIGQEEISEPVSPAGQYFHSSVLSLTVLAVLEFEIPFDYSLTMSLVKDVFLPIDSRFSSVMVGDKNGAKRWKRVEVTLKDHVNIPIFPDGMSPEFYDDCFNDYLSKIAMEQLPQSRPLWEIHIIKYPTSNSAGNMIFKLHHSLGDGYSLMGALLSCLQRADNPSLPLTFPSRRSELKSDVDGGGIFGYVPRFFAGIVNTVSDFGWSVLKSTCLEDDQTPIRLAADGVEFRPITITTMAFSLDRIKQIKSSLKVTINDAVTGIILFATRLYMQEEKDESSKANSTALVLLNTRAIGGYKSVEEMVNPNAEMPWGNHFAFLHVSIPKLTSAETSDPTSFILKTHQLIKRKRNSPAVYLTSKLLETLRILRGPEETSRYLYNSLKKSSMAMSNLVGPVEQMTLANHPIRGFYFAVAGSPQSLSMPMVSYMGKLRISLVVEKGFIDPHKFKSCIENAFEIMFKAAVPV